MNSACEGKLQGTHEGYGQVFCYVRMVGGVQKQFGDSTAKEVKVCEVESVDTPKIERPIGFSYLLPRLDNCGFPLSVTLLTNEPPHRADIIEMFENAKVPSYTCPNEFDSAINQWPGTCDGEIHRTQGPFPAAA